VVDKDLDNWRNNLEQDIMTDKLKEELTDVRRNIDLNYSRVPYSNPAINLMLKAMVKIMDGLIDLLEFPAKSEYVHDKEGTKKPHTFGIGQEDL
jgi:hypothetical protein